MAYTATRVATNFTSYTSSGSAIYVYTGSKDGGYNYPAGGTSTKLYTKSGAGGSFTVIWATNGQTITSGSANYNQLVKITGFSKKPKLTLLASNTTNVTTSSASVVTGGVYVCGVTMYCHNWPSQQAFSYTCSGATITQLDHTNAGWSRNSMALVIPNSNTTLSVYNYSGQTNEPRYAYITRLFPAVTVTATATTGGTVTGGGSYYEGDSVTLKATPNEDYIFKGYYVGSSLVSSNATYTFTVSSNTTVEARFQSVYHLTLNDDGFGAVDAHRFGDSLENVTLSVIPNEHYHFVKYVINGEDITTTPYTFTMTGDTIVNTYFEEDSTFRISTSSNFEHGSVYVSDDTVYQGESVTLWARPFPDYNFVRWSDGETTNPRTIVVNSDITLVAIYQRVPDTNGIYQYRCYVKDQLALTDPPKAFMVVDTFEVRTDYLTNATSSFTVHSMTSDVNEGDILVLYDPTGTTLYQGVIDSIEDLTIDCSQMQSFYKGTWIYNVSPQNFLEHEIAVLLQDYADGKLYRSSYVDRHVAQRLGGITIDYVGSTTVNLPTEVDDEGNDEMNTYDMEEFIYELYQKYQIEFDFEINFSGANYVHIRVPSYPAVKVGNNMFAIQDMLPITEIEETNKLVIYAQDKTYRTTYVATKNGIVEAPSSSVNRFNITNTEVVFSDDPVADLVANNLPQTMFNHKIEFTLIIKNFLYEFGEFNLGGELDIYYGGDYYNSVLTGYEITKESNQSIVSVHFICGLVRKKLTQLLTLGKV